MKVRYGVDNKIGSYRKSILFFKILDIK